MTTELALTLTVVATKTNKMQVLIVRLLLRERICNKQNNNERATAESQFRHTRAAHRTKQFEISESTRRQQLRTKPSQQVTDAIIEQIMLVKLNTKQPLQQMDNTH